MNNPVVAATGYNGMQIASPGTNVEGEILSVRAVNANAVFGAGCTVRRGDAPEEDDVLVQDSELAIPLSLVVVKTGKMYCFMGNPEPDN